MKKNRYRLNPNTHREVTAAIEAGQLDAVSQRLIEVYRDATTPLDEDTVIFLVQMRLLRAQGKLDVLMPILSHVVSVAGSLDEAAASTERLLLAGFLTVQDRGGRLSLDRGPTWRAYERKGKKERP